MAAEEITGSDIVYREAFEGSGIIPVAILKMQKMCSALQRQGPTQWILHSNSKVIFFFFKRRIFTNIQGDRQMSEENGKLSVLSQIV